MLTRGLTRPGVPPHVKAVVAKYGRGRASDRTFASAAVMPRVRGVRLPSVSARTFRFVEASGPDLKFLEAAVVRFNARHPYLLFGECAISRIRARANGHSTLITRLKASLREQVPASTKQELRAGIKRQGRCLIHTAFLALISDGETKADALYATRTALAQLSAEPSWKTRPVIKSFLDCAEIAVAVSLAYDWLYDKLSADEREEIEQSLLKQVLEPALAAYEDPKLLWPKRRDNCALVSNAGIILASLAMLERHPVLATQLV